MEIWKILAHRNKIKLQPTEIYYTPEKQNKTNPDLQSDLRVRHITVVP